MEDTLGEFAFLGKTWGTLGLNPCSNGRYSRRLHDIHGQVEVSRLNPCSNGRYSRRYDP